MTIIIKNAKIIAPQGIRRGNVVIGGKNIVSVKTKFAIPRGAQIIDAKNNFVSSGFIDLHIHGDTDKISQTQARFGTTGFLKTTYASGLHDIKQEIESINKVEKNKKGAVALGLNLEGPYINRAMCGALPGRFISRPNQKTARNIIKQAKGKLKIMTIAPEIPGALNIIRLLAKNKIIASIGHTDATYDNAKKAIQTGVKYSTHVFNRMKNIAQREPGTLGAVLEDDRVSAEIILDGIHVHPACFRILLKTKTSGRIVLATDSVSCGPIPGSVRKQGFFILKNSTYAGSALTMNLAVKNAMRFAGLGLCEAVKMATLNPARVLGIENKKGVLARGKDADIIIFDKNINVKLTIVEGKVVYKNL